MPRRKNPTELHVSPAMHVDFEHRLERAVQSASVPVFMSSKADIIEHYKDTYGAKNWTSEIAKALSGTTDKKSKEYKAAIRQFQGGREHKESRKSADKFRDLGRTLPPIGKRKPRKGYRFHVSGYVLISETWVKVNFSRDITGAAAAKLSVDPSFDEIWQAYFDNFEQHPVEDFDIASITAEALD